MHIVSPLETLTAFHSASAVLAIGIALSIDITNRLLFCNIRIDQNYRSAAPDLCPRINFFFPIFFKMFLYLFTKQFIIKFFCILTHCFFVQIR